MNFAAIIRNTHNVSNEDYSWNAGWNDVTGKAKTS